MSVWSLNIVCVCKTRERVANRSLKSFSQNDIWYSLLRESSYISQYFLWLKLREQVQLEVYFTSQSEHKKHGINHSWHIHVLKAPRKEKNALILNLSLLKCHCRLYLMVSPKRHYTAFYIIHSLIYFGGSRRGYLHCACWKKHHMHTFFCVKMMYWMLWSHYLYLIPFL